MTPQQDTSCHICRSERLSRRPFGYQFNGRRLEALACEECGIIFLHPQPSPDELAAMYSKEYFEGDFRCGHEGSYFDDATLARLGDTGMLDRIRGFQSGGKFLEIGCAGGAFLHAAKRAGYVVTGVEFSPEAAEFGRKTFGLDIRAGDVNDARFPQNEFDVVYLGDVLEHLPQPLETLREIRRIMKNGGLLVVLCPMQTNTLFSRAGFLVYGLLGRTATVYLPPYHLFEYRPDSMRELMRRSGFEVRRLKESAIPPWEIARRGSFLQNLFKLLFQYPNALLTKLFNRFGDRIELYAVKSEATSV